MANKGSGNQMKTTLIGSSRVDRAAASCLSEMSNNLLCLNIDHHRLGALNNGDVLIHGSGSIKLMHCKANAGWALLSAGARAPFASVVRANQYL